MSVGAYRLPNAADARDSRRRASDPEGAVIGTHSPLDGRSRLGNHPARRGIGPIRARFGLIGHATLGQGRLQRLCGGAATATATAGSAHARAWKERAQSAQAFAPVCAG